MKNKLPKDKDFCKRCGALLSSSGNCPGINCPTRKEMYRIRVIEETGNKEITLFSMPITNEEIDHFINYNYKLRGSKH